jgi:hypothetical protein
MRHTILRHGSVLAMAAALTLSACADAGESPGQQEPEATATATESPTDGATETPTDDATDEPTDGTESPTEDAGATEGDQLTLAATCETDRFTIDHPEGWWTNPGDDAPECRIFHPTEVEVENESLHYAVRAYIDPVAYTDAAPHNEDEGEELRREELTVDGRQAVVTEVRSSGFALVPEGERYTTAIVDLDGEILVLTTSTVGDTDYERDADLIERMLETVELTG